jgi:hypothetical protein
MSVPEMLIEKIKSLPPDRQNEVEDFVDFIAARSGDRALVRAAKAASAAAFASIWENPEDDIYDVA